ncbi:MAG: hydrogenase maturation protease [Pseudonocardiales bacterium]|nr:hydrogenase maturation protease [Pseudonocardiales bacterium]MDQ1750975.1 hydrogenase maturation protease [Pseudonocardiales bacterium]
MLVAGIGNIFFGDDGFGPEVVRQFAANPARPDTARVVDYGIRGMHLAFDLLDGWDALVLVDAIPSRGAPGTLHLIEIPASGLQLEGGGFDAHGMDPAAMLAGVQALGGRLPPAVLIGCEASDVGEGIGLTPAVAGAIDESCRAIVEWVARLTCDTDSGHTEPGELRTAPSAVI